MGEESRWRRGGRSRRLKYTLERGSDPERLVQSGCRSAGAAAPAAASRARAADRAGRAGPAVPEALIGQEVSRERKIAIPDAVREVYRLWRPTPLSARRLERFLDTPARIYYKYEGVSPAGSHKPNTAVAQAYYNKEAASPARDRDRRGPVGLGAGLRRQPVRPRGRRLHGQGQLRSEAVSPGADGELRRALRRQPSDETESGRKILAEHPDSPGSLGIAISEAVEMAANATTPLRARQRAQPRAAAPDGDRRGGDRADGADRRLSGHRVRLRRRRLELRRHRLPFHRREARGGRKVRVVAGEPAACPSLTRGDYAYDFGDTGH